MASGGASPLRHRWPLSSAFALGALAFLYVVVLPLVRPRGGLLWGHYRFTDVYAGIPLMVAALCTVAVLATPGPYRRAVALRLIAIAVVVVPAIFLLDLAHTVAQPRFRQPDFWLDGGHIDRASSIPDHQLGFVRKPHVSWHRAETDDGRAVSYRTDEIGFRNPPGTTSADVVFIGDSFTEAAWIPAERTFVGRVAERTGLRVVNLGRGAYGPQQELIVLERFGLRYQPKVVVWQLFEGNDLTDAKNFAAWRRDPAPPARSLKARYIESSLLYRLLEPTEVRPPSGGVPVAIRYRDGVQRRKELRYRFVPDQADALAEAFAETREAVETGARLCATHGIRLIVVFIPTMVQVLEPFITFERPEDRERALPGGAVRTSRDFGSRLKAVCTEPACSYVDVFETLRARALVDNTRVYDRHDPDEHLDVDGHDVVSQAIAKVIRSDTGQNVPGQAGRLSTASPAQENRK
jgi:GDSL-like Lipase/Acylhydrolase family